MAQLTAMELRKGMLVDNANRVCTVIFWNLWKSDRRSRVQLKVKDLLTGRITEITAQGDDKYNVLDSEVIQLSHSYTDGSDEVFYTLDGSDEWRCPSVGLEDVLRWNAESYTGRIVDGKLLTVDAPANVVAVVAETTPSIKGVLNGLKDAVLDNGITVKVGMVVNVGDKVRVDTETLEYKERVNS